MNPYKVNYELLTECCSEKLNVSSLKPLVAAINDWNSFYFSAYSHGVVPLVYKGLKTPELLVPKEVLLTFKTACLDIAQENMLMTSQLIKIFQLLEKNDIEAIAFKGPALSQLIYNDVITRQYSDVDILIDEESVDRAARLIMQNDYEMDFSIDFLKNKKYLSVGKDIHLTNVKLDVLIELHWKLFEKKFILKDGSFLKEYQEVKINNQPFNTLNIESLLLYLCMHGSKHFWERLEWIVDVDRLIRINPNINWTLVQEEASRMESKRLFYFGLLVVYSIFNTPLPRGVNTEMLKYKDLIILKDRVISLLFSNSISNMNHSDFTKERIHNLALLMDKNSSKIKSKFYIFIKLQEGDILSINLPFYLTWFYYLIHLLRILNRFRRKYIFRF